MIRKCFLCNSNKVETIVIQTWDLPGLDSQEIGFSICPECGLILQSPSLDCIDMNKYYTETATYINPGRKGKPTLNKQKDVERLIKTTIEVVGKIPNSAFQVGCSDGYTLSKFHNAGIPFVEGIDPSFASHKLSQELYNIQTIVGTFEEFTPKRQYDLVILTHVLEHLYDPTKIMNKCFNMQENGNWALIEVPLFERIDKFPPGLLSLEHLNYFSESTLLRLLYLTGYVPYLIGKLFYNNEYPVITVVARKEKSKSIELMSDYNRANSLLINYCEKNGVGWKRIELKVKKQLKKGTFCYVWGAGIHTSQLFAFTDLNKYLIVKGLLDSSPTKWGKQFGDLKCYSPDTVDLKAGDTIIISSYASEKEIYESLEKYRRIGVTIIRLYGGIME